MCLPTYLSVCLSVSVSVVCTLAKYVRMYVYACLHVCTLHVYECICMCTYTYTHTYINACIHCIHPHLSVILSTPISIYDIYIHIYLFIYLCMHACMHAYILCRAAAPYPPTHSKGNFLPHNAKPQPNHTDGGRGGGNAAPSVFS